MKPDFVGYLLFVGIVCIAIESTQQLTSNNGKRFPAYSLQNMPKTDFSCRGKILGGYYADADTQCQMFHICVKIAGVGVQDFRFLCPNGTAFDQEAQTCADFGDVDCEQATLFYGSDNFDLYRIGSGLDVAKRPTPATEDESTFHLQRAESNDLRRSKQPIAVQNALYNLGSSFNRPQSSKSQQSYELTSLKPANQYQPQKVATTTTTTTTTPRNIIITRKSTTTIATPLVTVKPTPFVLASSNSNNNDEIFKGSHSSNFYSNRNSNDDDDDYKKTSISNTAKSRHRSRGRAQYRGTPATITTTTTYKPAINIQNFTTFTPYSVKSTTASPFKFTFASTVRSNHELSSIGNQINSTPLGPLQQQYQQTNYNNNNFINFKATTTLAPIPTTLRSNFRPGIFNLITTPSTLNAPLRTAVSAPTPFNSNHNNGNNANAKPIINNVAPFNTNNNNIYNSNSNNNNNNLLTTNSSNSNRHRIFDNHNVINNYQTTSPFGNQRTLANHLPPNNTVLRLAPTQANHIFPQNSPTNGNSPRNISFYQSNLVTTTQSPSLRNSIATSKPNFNQQDLLNQFNADQRKFTQTPANHEGVGVAGAATNNNQQNNRRPDQAQNYRVQLHYDINDYLTTDKYIAQSYSPTSEQYRSVQTYSTPQASQSNQYFTTTKYYEPVFSTTPKTKKQQFDTNNQYQTQQDRPSQSSNVQINFKTSINTTPQSVAKQSPNNNNIINNNNNLVQTSTKKFSTLVPKENYAPTTFKPLFYFNVAKQINDHLGLSDKFKTPTDTIGQSSTTTTTTLRTVSIQPIFNRGPDFSQLNYRESTTTAPLLSQQQPQQQQQPQFKPQFQPKSQFNQPQFQSQSQSQSQFQQQSQPQFQPVKPLNITEIDENDGQYHPELYEKDFARYKIKNRKKQQQLQHLHNKPNFGKGQTDFTNKFPQNFNNRGTSKSVSTSTEEELLTAAYSQNIAASGNDLFNSKNPTNAKHTGTVKNTVNTQINSSAFNLAGKAPTIPPNATTTKKTTTISKDDKDVSYDYAYYDSGNDTPHDYSEFDLDFTKTRKQ